MEEVEDVVPEAGQRVGWHSEYGAQDVIDEGAHPLGEQHKTPSVPTLNTPNTGHVNKTA